MTTQAYRLGVDLGTTYTAAAVARNGRYRVVRLARDRADIPSTVCVVSEDSVLVGEQAEAVGHERPTAVARECKRRLGDSVPLILEGRPYSPQTLMAHTLGWTVRTVTEVQGGPPELLTVTCPANWGPYKHELLAQVIRLADVPSAIMCTEPEAAAFHHADETTLVTGSLIAVYDLGGGTFDAAVLRATSSGFALAGPPEGIEHMGGCDFDEAVFAHVLQALGPDAHQLAAEPDPEAVVALAALRRRCVVAKEILSTEPAASIEISLPGLQATVRLTRPEFEAMIKSALADTMRAFARTLRKAGVKAEDLSAVVLAGGSVRIPLVSETVAHSVNCPVVMPVDPSHSVALGAAMAADRYRIPERPVTRPTPPQLKKPPIAAQPRPVPRRQHRDATVTTRELLRVGRTEQVRLAAWLAQPGTRVAVGQPLARVVVSGAGSSRAALLRSPFEGTILRHFVDPGTNIGPDDLLVALREVEAYLIRLGRSRPSDAGVTVTINPPTTTTAFTGRPVVFVDRVPRALWWSGAITVLVEPGEHVVSAAYTRANQWFGFASQLVTIPEGGILGLDYTEPGVGATAVLRATTPRTS
jgi:actin-like ATPase involved in cell morphogenesis